MAFLNQLEVASVISFVVDVNPYRQGTYLAGTGHEIVAPEELRALKPDTVIIMNSIYELEIREMLSEVGLAPELRSL